MSRILLVSWSVFPGAVGSSVVINNIARVFGKNELVIVGEKPTDESSEIWLKDSNSLRKIVPGYPFSDQCWLVAAFDFNGHIYCLRDLPLS